MPWRVCLFLYYNDINWRGFICTDIEVVEDQSLWVDNYFILFEDWWIIREDSRPTLSCGKGNLHDLLLLALPFPSTTTLLVKLENYLGLFHFGLRYRRGSWKHIIRLLTWHIVWFLSGVAIVSIQVKPGFRTSHSTIS